VLRDLVIAFNKPVAYVHGDSHYFRWGGTVEKDRVTLLSCAPRLYVTVCSFSPSIYAQGEWFLMRRNCNCNWCNRWAACKLKCLHICKQGECAAKRQWVSLSQLTWFAAVISWLERGHVCRLTVMHHVWLIKIIS
jgi:hypothetical protein